MEIKLSVEKAPITRIADGVFKCKSITGVLFFVEKTSDFSHLKATVNQRYLWLLKIPSHSFVKMFNTRKSAVAYAVTYFKKHKAQLEDQFHGEQIFEAKTLISGIEG